MRRLFVTGFICGAALLLVGLLRLMVEKGTDEEAQCYPVIAIGGCVLAVSVLAMWLSPKDRPGE